MSPTQATMSPQVQVSSSWGPNGDLETSLFVIVCFLLVVLTSAALHGWMICRNHNARRHPVCRRHQQGERLEKGLATMDEVRKYEPLLPRGSSNNCSPCRSPSMSQVREIIHDAQQDKDEDELNNNIGQLATDSFDDFCLDGHDSRVGASLDGETYIYMRDIFGPKRTPPAPLPEYIKTLPRKH